MKKILVMIAIMTIGLTLGISVNAQTKKIGMKRATQIAKNRVAGKIEGSELEKEAGKWIYSFDIRNKKGTISEVWVNAFTGKVIKIEEENAKAESKEKREEKMEKKKN
ncbi:MAG TPA: PepSY domain-containing protein [Pyrinomonadaceae bacterium]|jgi:hypothetical protein